MQYSTNYNMKKPESTDTVNISDINYNTDIIDTQLAAKYVKASTGIPKTDLASAVQTSLGKADTALQSAPVTSVNTRTGAVTGLAEAADVEVINDELDIINSGTESVTTSVAADGKYVYNDGSVQSSSNFAITNTISLVKGQKISVTAKGYNATVAIISKYNSDEGVYTPLVNSIDSTLRTYEYTATKNTLVRLSYLKSGGLVVSINTSADCSVRLTAIEQNIDNIQDEIDSSIQYPQMFSNIVCVGDSLTDGQDGTQRLSTNYPFYLAKLISGTTNEQGISGKTAKQWWQECGVSFDFSSFDCAIIYLGTNGGLTDTVETDCNLEDPTQNADTNTGYYGRVISKIKSDNSACKIFCVAGPTEYIKRVTTMNPAVRSLASFYSVGLIDMENCLLSDNGGSYTTQRLRYRPIDGIHYNRLGYLTFANLLYDIMSKYMSAHLSEYIS